MSTRPVLVHPKLSADACKCALREEKSVRAFDEGNHLAYFGSVESTEAGQYIDGPDDRVRTRIWCHTPDSAPHKAGIQLLKMKSQMSSSDSEQLSELVGPKPPFDSRLTAATQLPRSGRPCVVQHFPIAKVRSADFTDV